MAKNINTQDQYKKISHSTKLWGAAFTKDPKKEVIDFCSGRDVRSLPPSDDILVPYEIKASMAYVHGLYAQKLIDSSVFNTLITGLAKLQKLYSEGKFHVDNSCEDVHSAVESWLTKQYGVHIAGKIHTGRSRNEQIAVDMLLFMEDIRVKIIEEIQKLITSLEDKSKTYSETLMPGYTHHQHATLTTFGAVFEAFALEFKKDIGLFEYWKTYALISPLGSAAGYGTSLPIDKYKINEKLGLPQVFDNPIQAISFKGDAESLFVYAISSFMNHLSTLAQTLILFSTKEFGYISLSDEYSTGSSIMPQKKNPDPLEVVKAKASVCQGYLMSIIGIQKSSFIGYNRDSQWSKYMVMDAIREMSLSPIIMAGVIQTLTVHKDKAKHVTQSSYILSQSIMEGLILNYRLPMRIAKIVVETAVKTSNPSNGITLDDINQALITCGIDIKVILRQYNTWIDPKNIVDLQLKIQKGSI